VIAQQKLIDSLTQFIDRADDGERIPTVRELMKTYGVGQAAVQETLRDLQGKGLVQSYVGRGSFVVKPKSKPANQQAEAAVLKSVLILSNVNMNARCTMVQALVANEIQALGAQVVQLSYSNTDQLLTILKGIPSFDAVIMQSHYESIPIGLLSALKNKTRALVIDGLTVAGVDVDRVGVDWLEVIGLALDHLVAEGYRRPALITIDSNAQPMVLTRRFFDRLRHWDLHEITTSVHILKGVIHPTQNPESLLDEALRTAAQGGADSFLFLGLSETVGIDAALTKSGLSLAEAEAVVILGHTDVPSEHLNKYSIAGVSHIQGAQQLVQSIVQRFKHPDDASKTYFLEANLKARPRNRDA
jgi:DNA-binding transcriptional regulator YhcF (GntR family)